MSIVDLHMHIVPGVDDGSRTIEESLEMLKLSEEQGVTDVFCTSHNGYSLDEGKFYIDSFFQLKDAAQNEGLNIRLHKGCEILCAGEYMDDILYGLEIGAFATLGNSKYVLTELYPDARPSEALLIIDALKKKGYKPIIAHMERNYNITGIMVGTLIESGALIQVNAHSFVDENNDTYKTRARDLLKNRYIHFIGSDAHRLDHRPPSLTSGINYIMENADEKYASDILTANANSILNSVSLEVGKMTNKEKMIDELFDTVSEYGLIRAVYATFGNKAKMNLGFTKRVCDVPIEDFPLSVRGYNVLKRSNINTLGELIDVLNDKKLMELRNLGEKTAREIKTKIVDYGYNELSDKEKKDFLAEVISLNS